MLQIQIFFFFFLIIHSLFNFSKLLIIYIHFHYLQIHARILLCKNDGVNDGVLFQKVTIKFIIII